MAGPMKAKTRAKAQAEASTGLVEVALRKLLVLLFLCLAAAPAAAATPAAGLSGRWNILFEMPQGGFETPMELIATPDGRVTASILGPIGNFRIEDIAGTMRADQLSLGAKTSYGRLRVRARLTGERLDGEWAPASFIKRMFFKGKLRGLRDRTYVPASRVAAFDTAWAQLERRFYAPDFNGADMAALRQTYRAQAEAAQSDGQFVAAMRAMLATLKTSHLDFFATPTRTSGLYGPPSAEELAAEASKGIEWRQLAAGIGYIKIASFEDGPEVLARVDRAFAELGTNGALVIDLRGNGGGSLGAAMRLGDHILPAAQPVGYFAGRSGLAKFGVRSIDQLDRTKLPAFSGYDGEEFGAEIEKTGALMLTTGGRAPQRYAGRIVLLVDEYSFSASEALAGVVKEARLATLIGRKTPGLMLGSVPVAIEGGWTLLLPVWDFRTPGGARVEGIGVTPDIAVRFREGKDADLAAALKFLKQPKATS